MKKGRIKKNENPIEFGLVDIAKKAGLYKYRCECGREVKLIKSLRNFFNLIIDECSKQNIVSFRGFGSFHAYIFRRKNYSKMIKDTGVELSDRLIIKFRPFLIAKKRVNRRYD